MACNFKSLTRWRYKSKEVQNQKHLLEEVKKYCTTSLEEKMSLPFSTELYSIVQVTWPTTGRHILGTFNDSTIILYQAYKPSIASYAVTHQTFSGCPDFSETRMTWLKPNFLWMMYRSGWASKKDQERILAIIVKLEGFHEILRQSSTKDKQSDVRLQWDPDHDPYGEKQERRAIQLGVKGKILQLFLNEWIVKIDDVTDFVMDQRQHVMSKRLDLLFVPKEKVYIVNDVELVESIGLNKNE